MRGVKTYRWRYKRLKIYRNWKFLGNCVKILNFFLFCLIWDILQWVLMRTLYIRNVRVSSWPIVSHWPIDWNRIEIWNVMGNDGKWKFIKKMSKKTWHHLKILHDTYETFVMVFEKNIVEIKCAWCQDVEQNTYSLLSMYILLTWFRHFLCF